MRGRKKKLREITDFESLAGTWVPSSARGHLFSYLNQKTNVGNRALDEYPPSRGTPLEGSVGLDVLFEE